MMNEKNQILIKFETHQWITNLEIDKIFSDKELKKLIDSGKVETDRDPGNDPWDFDIPSYRLKDDY